jgi:hypothetical protein
LFTPGIGTNGIDMSSRLDPFILDHWTARGGGSNQNIALAGILWTGGGQAAAIKERSDIVFKGLRSFQGAVGNDHLLNLEVPGQA